MQATGATQPLEHTEISDRIVLEPAAPDGAARELQNFRYSSSYRSPEGDLLPGHEGCKCKGQCSAGDCSCAAESVRGLESLKFHGRSSGVVTQLECGPACHCGPECPARTTQQGLAVKVTLHWNTEKGWCVHAAQHIPQGAFVCQYVGEYVTATEARRRLALYDQDTQKGHALLIVRLQLPSQNSSLLCCIDATVEGNVARFINHSCDGGNLEPILITIKGYMLPRVALFAASDIQPGEELTYAYCQAATPAVGEGETAAAAAAAATAVDNSGAGSGSCGSRRRCHCGAAACTGYLPSAL